MKRVVHFGLFTALALIFSYVESLIPFHIGIPGVKLGLANVVIVIALYRMTTKEVYLLSVTRVLLAGFLFANAFSIIYSLAGTFLSVTSMVLIKRWNRLSVIGTSICGGIFHNVGQLLVAMFVLETSALRYYVPVLIVAGMVTGLVIGITANEMLMRIKRI